MVNVTIYTIHGSYGYVHIYFIPFLGKPISHNLALSLRFTNCCKFLHPTNASSWSFAGSLGMKDMSSLAISLKTNPKSCHLDICRIQKTAVSAQTCCTSHHNRHLNSLSLSTTRHQAWTRRSRPPETLPQSHTGTMKASALRILDGGNSTPGHQTHRYIYI